MRWRLALTLLVACSDSSAPTAPTAWLQVEQGGVVLPEQPDGRVTLRRAPFVFVIRPAEESHVELNASALSAPWARAADPDVRLDTLDAFAIGTAVAEEPHNPRRALCLGEGIHHRWEERESIGWLDGDGTETPYDAPCTDVCRRTVERLDFCDEDPSRESPIERTRVSDIYVLAQNRRDRRRLRLHFSR